MNLLLLFEVVHRNLSLVNLRKCSGNEPINHKPAAQS